MQEKKVKTKMNQKKYIIKEKKFFDSVSEGETFKTKHYNCERKRQAGYTTYKQEFVYKLDERVIKDNEEKLLKLGILEEN